MRLVFNLRIKKYTITVAAMLQIPLEGDRRRRVGTMSAGLRPIRPSEKAFKADDEFIVLGRGEGKIIKEYEGGSSKQGSGLLNHQERYHLF